jgi:hypothetical protein
MVVQAIRVISATLIALLGLAALGLPLAAAQRDPPPQRMSHAADGGESSPLLAQPAGGGNERDTTRMRYFFEGFAGATPDRRNWELIVGVTPAQGLRDAGPEAGAVRLGLDARRADRSPELSSVPIPLAGAPGVELAYTVGHRGVEADEPLVVEYLAADGRWQTLDRLVAGGPDSVALARRARVLPVEALHDEFRLRFRPAVNDEDDAWFLGEVSVAAYDPLKTLTVRVDPARAAQIDVVLADRSDSMSFGTPLTRRYPVGSRLHLVPPPTIGEDVFSHWSLDGGAWTQPERVLTLELTTDIEAVAHYRPWVAGREEASVAIISNPLPGVPIALGTEPELLFTEWRAEAEYSCLTGEWLTLLAPPRSRRMVFVGWVVNGERIPGRDNLLEHHVGGDDILLAQYVLLGDMNGDDVLDKYDVDLFVAALIDPLGYAEVYPELDRLERGDINGDGAFDALDVEGFVDLLLND